MTSLETRTVASTPTAIALLAAFLFFLASGDSRSQDAPGSDPAEKAAAAIAERATRLYESGKFSDALKQWQVICADFAQTSQYGVAQFNVGYVLKQQGKFDAAIAEFEKLFASSVDDREPTTNIMEMFRNYRHRAANEIAKCHERQGKFAAALDWAIRAQNQFPYESWCGTCWMAHNQAAMATIARLTIKLGKDDRLAVAERVVFDEHSTFVPLDLAQLLAVESFRAGRSAELLEKIEAFRIERTIRHRQERGAEELPLDGHTQATKLIVGDLHTLRLAKRGDRTALWNLIRKSNVNALAALFPNDGHEAAIGFAAEQLISDPFAAKAFLHAWYKQRGADQAWALVLLAKLGEVRNVEAVHQLAAAIQNDPTGRRQASIEAERQDYLLAAVLADPASIEKLTERCRNTKLTSAAHFVVGRIREIQH